MVKVPEHKIFSVTLPYTLRDTQINHERQETRTLYLLYFICLTYNNY